MGTQTAEELIALMKSRGLDPRQQIQVDKEILDYHDLLPQMGVPGKELNLFNFRSQGRGLPLVAGRRFPGGSPIVMPMEEYIKRVVPGEAGFGDYVKDAASSALSSFMDVYGSAAQNVLTTILPKSAEEAIGAGHLAENVQIGSRAVATPSQDVSAHGGMVGQFLSRDVAGAGGALGAFLLPGLGAGEAAATLGASAATAKGVAAVASGAIGALSQSETLYDDILRKTGNPASAWKAYFAGLGIGATQAVDIPILLGIDKKTGGMLKDILVGGALGGASMGAQQAATEAVYATLTDEERNALANTLKAVAVGGVVGGGARGVGQFADNFLKLQHGATGELMDQLRRPGVPHEERVKSAKPWAELDPTVRQVADDFIRANESESLTEKQKDDMRRSVVTEAATPMEQWIEQQNSQRGAKTIFISHPGDALDYPSMFEPKTGTMVIDVGAAPQRVLASFWSHETSHLFENTNPDAAMEFMQGLEKQAPDLVQKSRERRLAAEPDGDWQHDPRTALGETFGQVGQDLGGLIYLLQTDPKFVESAIKGPGKRSIIRLGDAVIEGINKVLGKDFATLSERQATALKEINHAITGVSIDPKEAYPIAQEMVSRWNNLIGQTYAYTGGLATAGMTEPSSPAGSNAPRGASYERTRQGTGVPGQEPQTTTFSPGAQGARRGQKEGLKAEPPGGPEDVTTGTTGVAPGAAAPKVEPLFPEQAQAVAGEALPAEQPIQIEPGSEHAWMQQVLEAYGKVKTKVAEPAKAPEGEGAQAIAKPGEPLGLKQVSPVEPLLGAEKSEAVSGREATEPTVPSSAPQAEELGIMAEASPEETAMAEETSEANRLRTKAISDGLSSVERKRALELYANSPEGLGALTTLASGGEGARSIAPDVEADMGFKVSRPAAAAALHKAKVRPEPVEKGKPTISLDTDHPDYKPVSKAVSAYFKEPKVQGLLLSWRNARGGKNEQAVAEALSKAVGTEMTDTAIQRAIEQIAENKAKGVRAAMPKGNRQMAAFNPFRKGDSLLADASSEREALRQISSKMNEIFFNDFTAMDRVVKGRARNEGENVSLKQIDYWGRVGNKEEYVRKTIQKPVMETLARAKIPTFDDTPQMPSMDTYLLRKAAEKYQSVVDKRMAAEPQLEKRGKPGAITREEAAKIKEEASLLSPKDREAFLEKAYARREEQAKASKGSGISKQEIADFDRKFKALPRETQQAYDKAADLIYRMTAEGRRWMVEQKQITQAESDAWDKLFGREYVPHLSVYEPDSQFTPIGDGFQVPAKMFERVRGRTSRPYSPLVAVFNQAMQRAITSERNRVGRSLGELVKGIPDEAIWQHFDNHADIPENLVETGRVFRYIEDGKKQWVAFTGPDGKRMADAMRRLNIHSAGMFEKIRPLTRWVMNMATSWNVFFSLGNVTRDMLEAGANAFVDADAGFSKKVFTSAPASLKVAMQAADIPGIRDIIGKGDPKQIAEFRRFEAAGGRTGIVELQTYGNRMRRIQAEFKRYGSSKNPLHIKQHLSNMVEALESFNGAFEQATRFSAWKEARARGLSEDAAAAVAKDITINFNKRGTIAPSLGALYAFSSASLAGLHRFGRAVGTKRGMALAGGMAALGFMESMFNRSTAGEDKDGENAWSAINDYEKARSFRISDGGTGFFGFPMPWGWNIPVYIGVLAEHAAHGDMTSSQFAKKLMMETIENVNPVGGQTLAQAVTPTVGRFATEIGQNIDPFGRPIRPEPAPFDYATPNYEQSFRSVSPMWKEVSKQLAMMGGDEVKPGPIDISPEDLEHASNFMVGGSLRNAWRFASIMSDVLTGDSSRIGSLPGARYFTSTPSEESRAMRFHEVVKGAEKSKQTIERAKETGNPDLIEKTVTEEGGMASLSHTTQALQKAYSQLRKAMDAAESASEKAEYKDAMEEIQRAARTMKVEVTQK